MRRLRLVFLFLISAFVEIQAQEYRTASHNEKLRTPIVLLGDRWNVEPVLPLGSDQSIKISFDEMSHDNRRFSYRIIHCNADWTRSDMNQLEYLDGFSENELDDSRPSEGTFTQYTHYGLSLPNDRVKLKLSGNYAVEIFDRDGDGKVLMTACFRVLDRKVAVEGQITASTDVDNKQKYQQLSFDLKTLGMTIQQPLTALNVQVQQNHRIDNLAKKVKPLQIGSNLIRFDHNQDLIFEAGNEYRRFEITSFKYATLGVKKVAYFKPFYNAELYASETRLKGYFFDKDQNGRFLIRSQNSLQDDETGSDYFLVHFSLPMETPILEGGLYLNGDFVGNTLDLNSKMMYSFERKSYEQSLLLKQGAYNFQYLYKPAKTGKTSTQPIEGSYWETENEYQIFVYYRPAGERYDRLIGYSLVKTAF